MSWKRSYASFVGVRIDRGCGRDYVYMVGMVSSQLAKHSNMMTGKVSEGSRHRIHPRSERCKVIKLGLDSNTVQPVSA